MRRLGIVTMMVMGMAAFPAGNAKAITGGHEATPGAWPWMGLISYPTPPVAACGGTLIAPRWVLTAAHCTTAFDGVQYPAAAMHFTIGRHDHEDRTAGLEVPLLRYFLHPDYDPATQSPDVALLELAVPLSAPTIQIAHPKRAGAFEPGRVGTVMGWGAVSMSEGTTVLMQTDVPVADPSACEAFFAAKNSPAMPAWDGKGTLCGGYEGSPASPCAGDSGGPWVVKTKAGYQQIGTVSGGLECKDFSTYGNLQAPYVRDFIAAHVPGALATR